MSDISDCIIKILVDNGVSAEQKEIWGFAGKLENVIQLDFSEHDKVFENEIAGLKAKIAIKDMDYKTASELLGKYQQENEALKQRIAELENSETENTVEVRVLASPIEIATHLINNTCTINELKMIAEHINVYCNGGK